MSDKYEKLIKEYKLDEVVCAYRSIPIDENNPNSTNKSNIEIANDAFDLIKKYPKDFFCVIIGSNMKHTKLTKVKKLRKPI